MNITIVELVILALAVYRLSRLIIEDTILEIPRNWIWKRFGVQSGVGYLLTCYWCTSFWVASLVVTCFIIVPIPTIAVGLILALSAIAGILAARMDN